MRWLYFILIIFAGGMVFSVSAEEHFQELHIYRNGQVHMIGAKLEKRHAVNLYMVSVWEQRWSIFSDRYTKMESAYGVALQPEEILPGHILEIRGVPVGKEVGYIEASLIRDLSIKTGTPSLTELTISSTSPMPTPQQAAVPPAPAKAPTPAPAVVAETGPSFLTENLRLGSRGREVAILQEFLQKNGWGIPADGPVTGYFGKVTKDALAKFQEAKGLEAVGEVGPQTRSLINSFLSKPASGSAKKPPSQGTPATGSVKEALGSDLTLGARGKKVVILQEFLQKGGWGIPDDGPVTGYFGKVTVRALENFQKAKGLAAVGMLDQKTRELVNSLLNQ